MRYLLALLAGIGVAVLLTRKSGYVPQLPAGQYADIPQEVPAEAATVEASIEHELPPPADPVSEAIDTVSNTIKNAAVGIRHEIRCINQRQRA